MTNVQEKKMVMEKHTHTHPGVGKYCNAFGMTEVSSWIVVSSLLKHKG